MVFRINCPSCQQLMGYTEAQAGRQINCPRCKKGVVVPPLPQAQVPEANAFAFDAATNTPTPFDLGDRAIIASPWRGVRAGIGWVRLGVLFLFLTVVASAAFQIYVLRFVANGNQVLMSNWIKQVAFRFDAENNDSSGDKATGSDTSLTMLKIAGIAPFVGVGGILFSALFILFGLARCFQGPSSFFLKLLPLGALVFLLLSIAVAGSLPFLLAYTTPHLDGLEQNMKQWEKSLWPYLLGCKAILIIACFFGLCALGCFLLLVRSVCHSGPTPRLVPWILPFLGMVVFCTIPLILADFITGWLAAQQKELPDQLAWRSNSNQVLFGLWFVLSLLLLGWFIIVTIKAQRFLSRPSADWPMRR
jgi:hypothetical protein